MPQKKTNEEFVAEVRNLVGDEYTFLEPYINAKTKIKVRHNICGKVYRVTPGNFIRVGNRCPYCSSVARKTNEQFLQEVQDLVGNEYTFLEPYVNSGTKIKVRHNACKQTYLVKPDKFLRGQRCPYCVRKKSNEQFLKEVYKLVDDEYTFLEPYQDVKTKIKVRHNVCSNIYRVRPDRFLGGNRCPYCAGKRQYTPEEFAFKVHKINPKVTLLEPYQNQNKKIRTHCNVCGNIWYTKPASLESGHGCPKCAYKAIAQKEAKTNKQFLADVKERVGDEYTFLEPYVNNYTRIKARHNPCGTIFLARPGTFLYGVRCPYCTSRSGGPVWKNILYTKKTGWIDKSTVQHKDNN